MEPRERLRAILCSLKPYDGLHNNGNTTSANSNTYAYDFENHLTSLNGGSAGYVYDGDGNRVAKTVGGITTNYLVDTNNPTGYAQVVDELQSGSVVKSFTYGHDLISQRIIGGSLSFYGYDGHGSVRLLTDAAATITDSYGYDAFGNLISHTGTTPNDYLYSGEQLDANLGFYYLRARYMNPTRGMFLSFDTFEGNSEDPNTLHKYLYTGGNPVNRDDPSGHDFNIQTIAIVVGVIGVLAAISVSPAIYNSHFKGRSGGNEPLIEIESRPVIVEVNGWDYSVAVGATAAAATLLISIWATFAGLDRSYEWAKVCAVCPSKPDLSAHILGTKICLVLMLMLAARLIGLIRRTRVGYVVALVALVAAVVTFGEAWSWSTNTALAFDRQLEVQGRFGGYSSFFMYGTSPYAALLLIIFLFIGVAGEIGLVVTTTWHRMRKTD